MTGLLNIIEEVYPTLFSAVEQTVTARRLVEVLRRVADSPAPSQTASFTRGRVISQLLENRGLIDRGAKLESDLADSGCDLLTSGMAGARFIAHIDEISYVISGPANRRGWPLTAYCYHLADGPRAARVLRYDFGDGYGIVSHGKLVQSEDDRLWYEPDDGVGLQPGDRVTLSSPLSVEGSGGRVTGALDNAAGVACVLLAAEALTVAQVPYSVLFTDEEEGPAGRASQTISRGATRALAHLPPAPLTVVVDTHGLSADEQAQTEDHRRTWGASLSEFSSATRGSVTPPHLYRSIARLVDELATHDVRVRQNIGGYVPRSDDIAAMLFSNRVCLLGYPGTNRHFDHGLPAANLEDLLHLAKALVAVGAAAAVDVLDPDRRP